MGCACLLKGKWQGSLSSHCPVRAPTMQSKADAVADGNLQFPNHSPPHPNDPPLHPPTILRGRPDPAALRLPAAAPPRPPFHPFIRHHRRCGRAAARSCVGVAARRPAARSRIFDDAPRVRRRAPLRGALPLPRRARRWPPSCRGAAAAAETALPPILDALRALLVSHSPPPPAHLRRSSDFAAHGLCRSLKPPNLLQAYLSVLLEERILLVSREPLLLARACHCLVSCLHPLEFCGACVPYLPEGLHPHLETLLNEAVRSLPPLTHTHSATRNHTRTHAHTLSDTHRLLRCVLRACADLPAQVEPFIVGVLSSLYIKLRPLLTDEIVTIDLDAGSISGGANEVLLGGGSGSSSSGSTAASRRRQQWLRTAPLVEAARALASLLSSGSPWDVRHVPHPHHHPPQNGSGGPHHGDEGGGGVSMNGEASENGRSCSYNNGNNAHEDHPPQQQKPEVILPPPMGLAFLAHAFSGKSLRGSMSSSMSSSGGGGGGGVSSSSVSSAPSAARSHGVSAPATPNGHHHQSSGFSHNSADASSASTSSTTAAAPLQQPVEMSTAESIGFYSSSSVSHSSHSAMTCIQVLSSLTSRLSSVEHSPLRTSSSSADRLCWERMNAMKVLTNAIVAESSNWLPPPPPPPPAAAAAEAGEEEAPAPAADDALLMMTPGPSAAAAAMPPPAHAPAAAAAAAVKRPRKPGPPCHALSGNSRAAAILCITATTRPRQYNTSSSSSSSSPLVSLLACVWGTRIYREFICKATVPPPPPPMPWQMQQSPPPPSTTPITPATAGRDLPGASVLIAALKRDDGPPSSSILAAWAEADRQLASLLGSGGSSSGNGKEEVEAIVGVVELLLRRSRGISSSLLY